MCIYIYIYSIYTWYMCIHMYTYIHTYVYVCIYISGPAASPYRLSLSGSLSLRLRIV